MKRFLVFKGHDYYPLPGWDDFFGDFDTLDEAEIEAKKVGYIRYSSDWSHIVDLEQGSIIQWYPTDD